MQSNNCVKCKLSSTGLQTYKLKTLKDGEYLTECVNQCPFPYTPNNNYECIETLIKCPLGKYYWQNSTGNFCLSNFFS